jgi:alpha-N-arabinofuranosidase
MHVEFAGRVFGILILVSQVLVNPSGLAQSRAARINIDAAKVENSVDQRLYGQFVEDFFQGVQGPLWAELIRNRSFEEPANEIGLPRYWEREPDDRNLDDSILFKWDASVSYPSTGDPAVGHSLRISIQPALWDPRQRRGVSQGRIPVQKGVPYRGYIWLKSDDYNGNVTVALEKDRVGGERYASVDIPVKKREWTKYEFTLAPTASDPLAKLSILFRGLGRIWLDHVSLLPGDSVDGVRSDVFKRIHELHPSMIRWPGGNVAQNYHWAWGIGNRDQRPSWIDHAWWGQAQVSDFGTEEFIRMCRNLGAEPSITVNVEGAGATAEEAASWVEYANGPAESKYGRMRATDGYPEPNHVTYWEIGNEIFGDWEIGHTSAETYAHSLNRYVAAMKAVDPGIKIIASGSENLEWNRTLLTLAGQNIDYVAIHHYYGESEMKGDTGNLLAHPLSYGRFYGEMRQMLRQLAPARQIQLMINEWNTALPLPSQESMLSGLYAGRMMNMFERNGDVIASSAISDLVNGWPGGIIQASRHGLFVTPSFLVNRLYSNHLGTERLAAEIQSPVFDTTGEDKGVPYLDAVATRSSDRKKIFIKVVNTDLKETLRSTIHVSGARVERNGEIESILAPSPDAGNDFSSPDNVYDRVEKLKAANDFDVVLPKNSVSVITLNIGELSRPMTNSRLGTEY